MEKTAFRNTATTRRTGRASVLASRALIAAVLCAASSYAGLVAKWDFNNYDPENPTSAAILAPTVGSLSAIPYTGTSTSTAVTDGTLGNITVLAPSETGLFDGDYALAIPTGAHLWMPLPAGIVSNKCWTIRIRFNMPSSSPASLNTLISGRLDPIGNDVWFVSSLNLIQGAEGLFGTSGEENQNSTANMGQQKNNGAKAFRLVSRDTWHSFTTHFGPTGTSSTLDGYRSVSMSSFTDVRAQFTGDGFVLCGAANTVTTYIASVEVWADSPIYHDVNGAAYIPTSSRKFFEGCSLEDIRDMYISAKGLGSWGGYARTMSSWEHVVTTDAEGNVTDLKIDLRGKNGGDAIMCDFMNSGSDVAGNTLRMQWSLGWPNHYFTAAGGFTSAASYQTAPASYNGNGYAAYNTYALPFRPLDGSLTWSMQMGYGKFGNPFFTIVGDNPTLTFDVAPEADSLTLDCGRGDGKAAVTLAYSSDALKTMSSVGDIKVRENVTVTIPAGVSITGSLTLERKAALVVNSDGMVLANRDVVLTAAEGISIPAGMSIEDVATIAGGTLELSTDMTQLIFLENSTVPVTAIWIGLGDRTNVLDTLNWQCRNVNGAVLDGALPTEETAITISGETTFNLPTNQASRLQYRSLEIASCSLAADCDWRGLGASIPYAASTTIDLKGHKLYTCDVTSSVVVTNSLSGEPGECHLDIAVYATATGLNMKGNVRLVKEGAAEVLVNYTVNPTYTGGTEIRGGRIASTANATAKYQFGPAGSEIVIRSGATLYPYSNENWLTLYPIVMDGGSIYTWWSSTYGVIIGSMRLLANSSLDVYSGGKLFIWQGHTVNLNGHTLALVGDGEKCLGNGVTFTEGVVDFQKGTVSPNGTVHATNTTWLVGGALNLGSYTLNVSNYVARYNGNSNSGTGALNVYGTFTPSGHDKFYGCTMRNGSTIDLSARTNALPLVSAFTSGDHTLKFADNSTVYINIGNRKINRTTPVISWDEKPANIRTVKFKNADPESSRIFVSRDDGVYGISGFVIIVR